MSRFPFPQHGIHSQRTLASLTREEAREMCDFLIEGPPVGLTWCLEFFILDTKELWHNRARALIARRLKHIQLTNAQKRLLVDKIIFRFKTGDISEQFKDQLRLAIHLDNSSLEQAATDFSNDSRSYIRRYAAWILNHANTAEQGAAANP